MNTVERRVQTGVVGLDEILHGGLIPERLYLMDGNPGSGKTTFALHFLREGVRQGREVPVRQPVGNAERAVSRRPFHGWSLDDIQVVELTPDEQDLNEDGPLTMVHPSDVELSSTMHKIFGAIDRIDPSRVVLDSLSELRLLAQNSLRYRRQILALKQFFVGRRCTVLLLDDRTAEGPDVQLHSIAHGVIGLYVDTPTYGQSRRQVQVIKFRGSDFESGFHDFAIRQDGITVFPRLVAAEHGEPFERSHIESGVIALDVLLGGGVERGTSTLLVGPPGCGKSTLALQYAAAAAARRRARRKLRLR